MKKTKLSLEPPDPEGFQEVTGTEEILSGPAQGAPDLPLSETTARSSPAPGLQSIEQIVSEFDGFKVSSNLWDVLQGDPSLKADLERIIDERVHAEIDRRSPEISRKIEEDARREGIQKGIAEIAEQLGPVRERLNKLCGEILSEKESILMSHAQSWCRAFSYLLKRFLVPRQGDITPLIQNWLMETLADYPKKEQIRVFLSPKDFGQFAQVIGASEAHWKFESDAKLKTGEIRCDCAGGGIFFSPSEEFKKLDTLLNENAF